MYVAALNKKYENLVSNLAWSGCIYLKKSVDFTTEFPYYKINICHSILLTVDDKLKRVINSQLCMLIMHNNMVDVRKQ